MCNHVKGAAPTFGGQEFLPIAFQGCREQWKRKPSLGLPDHDAGAVVGYRLRPLVDAQGHGRSSTLGRAA
jgi:hypothetical protein